MKKLIFIVMVFCVLFVGCKKVETEFSERDMWVYSVNYPGDNYSTHIRCFQRQQRISGEWVKYKDEINYHILINCVCDNVIEIKNRQSVEDVPLKFLCSQCNKDYEFVLHEGILVEQEDTIMDDKEIFRRKHYVRFIQPNS